MKIETTSVIGILIICWVILIILDLSICGIIRLAFGKAFRKMFLQGLYSLLLPPAFIAYGIMIERNIYKVREIEITSAKLPDSFDGYRVVHISDIHARSFAKRPESLKKAVEKINALNADMVAFTGDLITMRSDEIDMISDILCDLQTADGTFSVAGNHDYCIYSDPDSAGPEEGGIETVIEKEESMGWKFLRNENVILKRQCDSIAVIGVENTSPSRHFPSAGNLAKASEDTEGMFRILLSHDPMHWDMEVKGKDYPLMLSGHTHAMQFSLFGWSPSRYLFKQYRGLYRHEDQFLHVNTGLGETIFPARIGVQPEITLITLRKES